MKPNLFMNRFIQISAGIVGFLSAIVTIYVFWTQSKEGVNLQYHLTANTNVFDINADISRLDIIYENRSLKEGSKNLRIMQLKITNVGTKALLMNYYDPNQPLGFAIDSGTVIESPEVIQASSEYLRNNFKILKDTTGNIVFSQVIFDKNSFVVVKFLVLHDRDSKPVIVVKGKIAEQESIPLYDDTNVKPSPPFWGTVYEGDIGIQLVRLVSYTIVTILLVLAIGSLIALVISIINKQKRRKYVKEFKSKGGYEYRRVDDTIFNRYISDELHLLASMDRLLESEEFLNKKYKAIKEESGDLSSESMENMHKYSTRVLLSNDMHTISEMITDGLVINNGSRLTINHQMKKTLTSFILFLKKEKNECANRFMPNIIDDELVSQRLKLQELRAELENTKTNNTCALSKGGQQQQPT